MDDEVKPFLPLSTAELYILLALAGEPRHGYGIIQEIRRQSGGEYRIGPGTLYDNLQKLMENGAVREFLSRGKDARRRYELTELGQRVLAADTERLRLIVRQASVRLRALEVRR
jgi:DNA-binding PadR family transcriptional regulator